MSTNAYMTAFFAAMAIPLFFGMKLTSLALRHKKASEIRRFLFLTPLHSVDTWAERAPIKWSDVRDLLLRASLFALTYLFIIHFAEDFRILLFTLPRPIWGYAVLPFILILGELISTLLILGSLVSGYRIPNYHRSPLVSRSLTEFWGMRWNAWQSDWFRQVIFQPLRRYPIPAVLLVFLISGIAHEFLFVLPLYLRTGESQFGGMTLYFTLQGVGILADRKFFRGNRGRSFRRFFLWAWLLLPTPIFIAEAVLRTLHVWPDR